MLPATIREGTGAAQAAQVGADQWPRPTARKSGSSSVIQNCRKDENIRGPRASIKEDTSHDPNKR